MPTPSPSPVGAGAFDRRLLLAIVYLLTVVVVSSNSSGSLAQPAIAREFGAGAADVGWVVFGYSVTFAISTALWGGLGGRLGLGPSLAIGIVLFASGGLAAVSAPSLLWLLAARVIQGLGSGAIPTMSAAIIARRFPPGRERARALGVTVAGVATGLAVGPVIGGLALQLVGWHGAVAFGIISAPAALLFARLERDRIATRRFDGVGAALVAATAFSAIVTANRLPILGLTPLTAASLGGLVVFGFLLGAWSLRREDAFLPRRVLLAAPFLRVILLGALGMSTFLGSMILVPTAAAAGRGLTGMALGLVLLPLASAAAVASLGNARVEARLGRRSTTALSLGLLALGAGSAGLLGAAAPSPLMAIALVPAGIGFGLLGPPLLNELTVAFHGSDQPVAVGAYNLVYFLGGALGASLVTAIVQSGPRLPWSGEVLPGFTTAETLVAIGPAVAALALIARSRRSSPETGRQPVA